MAWCEIAHRGIAHHTEPLELGVKFGLLQNIELGANFDISPRLSEISKKLIGVQSNHGVEYFGGPAAPTLRFLQNQQFLPQYKLHTEAKEALAENLAKIASELSFLEPI